MWFDTYKANSGVCDGDWIKTPQGGELISINPSTEQEIATVSQAGPEDYARVVDRASIVFKTWREIPAPERGEIVRQIGEELRRYKKGLGRLIALETGKILAEGEGEVQEMIDICDFAVGLSRQLYGLTMHSERPHHRMYEQWHPLGPVGVITAFNFPAAVWAWNAAIAAVCGDTVIWKPSREAPLTAIVIQKMCNTVLERHNLKGVFTLLIGTDDVIGERLIADRRILLISATGSCRMGRHVAEVVGKRLGRALLELGGNNAVIVMNDADLDLAVRAILFGAVGTAGQRCTTIRRLIMQKGIFRELTKRLVLAYRQIKIGDPLEEGTIMGPLINQRAVLRMREVLDWLHGRGAEIVCGGNTNYRRPGFFVEPTIVRTDRIEQLVRQETFAPILYLFEVDTLNEAIDLQNDVPQGLSSAIFTDSLIVEERFLSATGSDSGIANVNIGTSGAEIGGAFGGEKDTGGGREAGSDSWKAYMRRQTCTINWSGELPLAQGIKFGVES